MCITITGFDISNQTAHSKGERTYDTFVGNVLLLLSVFDNRFNGLFSLGVIVIYYNIIYVYIYGFLTTSSYTLYIICFQLFKIII
jgi:hypothetical protein